VAAAGGGVASAPAEAAVRPGFRLVLVDMQPALCEHFRRAFARDPNVTVVNGRFEALPEFDCMVSAANSFGLMDGGVDAAITKFFGSQLQKRVQAHILDRYDGEQPVGSSFIISTGDAKHPWLAHTPTMRVPYSIQGTDHVYLAFKAMCRAIYDHNLSVRDPAHAIRTAACTGFGTFYGKMALDEAARQMHLAWANFVTPPGEIHWDFAGERQTEVRYGGFEGFMRELRSQSAAGGLGEAARSRTAISDMMAELAADTASTNKQPSGLLKSAGPKS